MLKNILKVHCEINNKSMKKNVWIFRQICRFILGGFLGGFWRPFWLSKSMKNPLKNWAKFWLIFWRLFEWKCFPNGRPGGPQNRYISCTFRDPVPGTPLGKQMEPKWTQNETKMVAKWSPNWVRWSHTGDKMHKKSIKHQFDLFVLFYIYLFIVCWLE